MGRSLGALEAQRLRLQRSIDELLALRLQVEQVECQKLRDSQLALPSVPIRLALPDLIRQDLLGPMALAVTDPRWS